MSVFASFSPVAQLYSKDRKKLKDYETQIDAYQSEVEKYKPVAMKYQQKVDAFNADVKKYNKTLRLGKRKPTHTIKQLQNGMKQIALHLTKVGKTVWQVPGSGPKQPPFSKGATRQLRHKN